MRANMGPALREQIGHWEPAETRNFFSIATHHEPLTLYTHFYHWWDLARMRDEPHPSPIRRGALLYNIWDNRAEGMATAMEEFMLHAGLFDDSPRTRVAGGGVSDIIARSAGDCGNPVTVTIPGAGPQLLFSVLSGTACGA